MVHLGRFTEILNPYTPGSSLGPGDPTFFGREDTFTFIGQNAPAVEGKGVLALVGQRRIGKTSILKHLSAQLRSSRYIPIYIDSQGLGIDPGLKSFFLSLSLNMADGLEKAGIAISPPALSDLRDSPQHFFEQRFLPAVRERIGERTLLFTIDEFEALGASAKIGHLPYEIFLYLRYLVVRGEQLAFVFAGTHRIEELVGDYWSVFFNTAIYHKISFLNQDAATRLITEPVRSYGMVYDDLTIKEIMRLTAGHPYYIQLLCYILVEHCNEARRNYVTVQDLHGVLTDLLKISRAPLEYFWKASSRETKLTLAALAELSHRSEQESLNNISNLLRNYNVHLDSSTILEAIDQLISRDVIFEISGKPPFYRFAAQLYAHWIHCYKALSKVVEEMNNEIVSE